MNQIKFGLQTSPHQVSYDELLQVWQRADALGFDSAWLFDHFMPISGDPAGPCFEGWTMLAALAVQTRHLRVGTLVTSIIYRSPAVLAKIAATLDVACGGRLEMGLGAGWFEGETRAYGLPFPPVRERLARLDEGIQVMRSLWTEELSSFNGDYYHLSEARCEPKPLQKPSPPIWVGGQGERVTLRIVAERADGWDTDLMALPDYQRKLDALSEHCQRAGRDPASVRKMIHFSAAIAETESAARQKAEALAQEWHTDLADLGNHVLLGTPQQAADQLRRYLDLGVEHFVLSVNTPYDMGMIELYIHEVAPLLTR